MYIIALCLSLSFFKLEEILLRINYFSLSLSLKRTKIQFNGESRKSRSTTTMFMSFPLGSTKEFLALRNAQSRRELRIISSPCVLRILVTRITKNAKINLLERREEGTNKEVNRFDQPARQIFFSENAISEDPSARRKQIRLIP